MKLGKQKSTNGYPIVVDAGDANGVHWGRGWNPQNEWVALEWKPVTKDGHVTYRAWGPHCSMSDFDVVLNAWE